MGNVRKITDRVLFLSEPETWQGQLTRSESGNLHTTVANAQIVLGCDPAVKGIVAYNDFAHSVIITRPPPAPYDGAMFAPGPYPRPITDNDTTLIQSYIQREHGLRISQGVAQQAVVSDAENNRIHPVRDWLAQLVWDGKPRVATWLSTAFGCEDDAYYRAVGTKLLCAAVRRVRLPGCKFDHVVVFEGDQGKGKSRACAALFGMDWFTDNLSHDLANKDAQQGMSGKWGLELAELNVLVRSTSQAAKAFFSRQVDYYRPPYGKLFVERPRQCVFIGTTNDADYLTDSTGNRRYWPVYCKHVDVEWIEANRDHLWAEAVMLDLAGEKLWLENDLVQAKAVGHQSQRMPEDVWAPRVREWLSTNYKTTVKTADILHDALQLPRSLQNRSADMRVAAILKADEWERHKCWREGRTVNLWFAPGLSPQTENEGWKESDVEPSRLEGE